MWVPLAWIRGSCSRAISKWVPCASPGGVMLVGGERLSGVASDLPASRLVHLVTKTGSPISWNV